MEEQTNNAGYRKGTKLIKGDGTIVKIEDLKKGNILMGIDNCTQKINKITKINTPIYEITPTKGKQYYLTGDQKLYMKYSNVETVSYGKCAGRARLRGKYAMIKDGLPCVKYINYEIKDETENNVNNKKNEVLDTLKNMENKLNHHDIVELTVKQYIKLGIEMKTALKLCKCGINFKHRNVPIDPYLLGIWFGDGTSAGTNITCADEDVEIINKINSVINNCGLICKKNKAKYRYNITTPDSNTQKGGNKFRNYLKDNKLLNNKHIPDLYKYNSRDIRLRLLAGLIDSDGHYAKTRNIYSFTMSNRYMNLITDMIYLIRSLGFPTYKLDKKASYLNKETNERKYFDSTGFAFSGYGQENIPCVLSRKKASEQSTHKSNMITGFTVKLLDNQQECYKIEMDKPGKILLGDFGIGYC